MKKIIMIIIMITTLFYLVSCGNENKDEVNTITSKEKSDLVYMGYEKVYENIVRKYDMSYECESLIKIKYKNEGLFEYGVCAVKYKTGIPSNSCESENNIKIKYYAANYEEGSVSFLISGNVILKEILSVEFAVKY